MLMLRVCSVGALARLLLLRDTRLGTLSLRGYVIVDTNAPRRTRSSRATSALRYMFASGSALASHRSSALVCSRYSLLPLPSKIVSVLAQAWSTSRSSSATDPFVQLFVRSVMVVVTSLHLIQTALGLEGAELDDIDDDDEEDEDFGEVALDICEEFADDDDVSDDDNEDSPLNQIEIQVRLA